LRYDPKQWERGKPYPPLATIQVAALLRRMGHEVTLFDAMLADGVEAYEASLSCAAPDVVVLYEDNFNFLTKMCLGRMREAACRMIAAARARGARVIVAGSDASDHPESFLAAGADVVVAGEGIAALVPLIERLDSKPDIDTQGWVAGLAGVSIRDAGQPRTARIGAQPPDAQLTGLPAWDLIDIERYRALWLERHGHFSLNMTASRIRPRHILVRKLKLSSYRTTTSGVAHDRDASYASTPSASIASNRVTSCPILRSKAATWMVASGG
jgi:anaerobic magnesium-protoporphyrin IX monomethyl ester cyclase